MLTFGSRTTPTAETRTTVVSAPVNNIIDNLNWTKGNHNFEIGGNWRLVHQNRVLGLKLLQQRNDEPVLAGRQPTGPFKYGKSTGRVQDLANSYTIAYLPNLARHGAGDDESVQLPRRQQCDRGNAAG